MNTASDNNTKPSGVAWLGDIPKHWEVKRFCDYFTENKRKNIGMIESTVLTLSYGSIKIRDLEKENKNKGLIPESFETYQIIEPNDIIFRFTDLQNDKRSLRNAISKYRGIITSAYISVRTTQNADFFNYLFRSYDLRKVFYTMGDGVRQSLKMSELKRMPIIIPPLTEQRQIAAYLDEQTAKIDRLCALKSQLLDKLAEKRSSLISQAVTKGLNPNAEMKPSGVAWLGEMPEHWEVKRLKFMAKIQNGRDYKDIVADDGYPVIGSGGEFAKASDFIYQGKSVLLGRKGTIDKPLFVDDKFWTVDTMFYTEIYENTDPKYLYYCALTINFGMYATQTALPSMTQSDYGNIAFAVPKTSEQTAIAAYLDEQTAQIDRQCAVIKQAVEKLQEYKTALISHAVTGKIKVRSDF